MSIELQYLIFAVFLVLIQMVFQSLAGIMANGLMGAAGSRDDEVLLYIITIPFLRTFAWVGSMIGILMLAWPLLGQVT